MRCIKILFPFFLVLISCEERLFEKEFENTPENNFEIFWNDFDRFYAYFELKNVKWDSIYSVYKPKVNGTTNNSELFKILSEMSLLLKDGHVNLYSPFGFSGYNFIENSHAPTSNWIRYSTILNYTNGLKSIKNTIQYGKIRGENIGFIFLTTFSGEREDYLQIDNILEEFSDTDAIIIDVRTNGGGNDSYSKLIASRFADKKRLYRKYRYRNGTNHNDFTNWVDDYIIPSGKTYLKPVYVLTHVNCFSSAEDFILGMRVFPHVTTVGDTTGGGSGNPVFRELPNGWIFRMSNWQAVDANMNNIEGKGIYPDIPVWITKEEYNNNIDGILEMAIKQITNQ